MGAVPKSAFKLLFINLKHPATDATCKGPGPNLQFDLGDITLELEPRDYAMLMTPSGTVPNQTATNQALNETNNTATNNTQLSCKPMMMAMDFPEPMGPKLFILGEPVLRKYH